MAETDLIASLKQINATLLQEMEGKQQEVEELRKHLEELVGSDDDNLKDRKIVDLAKKNKALTVQLNKEKSKASILASEVDTLKKKIEASAKPPKKPKSQDSNNARHFASPESNQDSAVTSNNSEQDSPDAIIKDLKQKYDKELQESMLKSKQEFARIKAAFQKEVGEDVNIETILNKDTWKGRAQQIILLKSKVKDLQKQMEMDKPKEQQALVTAVSVAPVQAAGDGLPQPIDADTSILQPPASPAHATQTKEVVKSVDDKSFELLEKLDKESKAEVSELRKQITQKAEEVKQMKKKNEAANARIKILESSTADMKTKFTRVLSKTENDDKLIEALKAELETTRKSLRQVTKQQQVLLTKNVSPQEMSVLQLVQKDYDDEVTLLKKNMDALNKDIKEKDDTIRQLKIEMQAVSKKALDTKFSIKDLKEDKAVDDELKLKLTVAEIEVEKLRELKKLLDNRIQELETEKKQLQESLTAERQKNVELDKKCQNLSKQKPDVMASLSFDPEIRISELEDKLSIVHDENLAIKQTLHSVQLNREQETQLYQDLMDKQKSNYQLYIRELKQKMKEASIDDIPDYESTLSKSMRSDKQDTIPHDSKFFEQEAKRLRSELKELKSRYNAIAMQLQQKQPPK